MYAKVNKIELNNAIYDSISISLNNYKTVFYISFVLHFAQFIL